jgi:mannose-6-phosphate isomerase-like protein (cupin superfamily)
MRRKLLRFGHGFRVALGNRRSQAAEMVLAPGESEGGPDNAHRGSDQWLFVVSGAGAAVVNGRRHPLRQGAVLLIERGDRHDVPPAYRADSLPRGRGNRAW